MGQVSSLAPSPVTRPSRPGVGAHRTYLLVQTRSIFACFLHWILVGSVATLAVTGFYIADPFDIFVPGEAYQSYVMGKFRLVHFMAAGTVIATMLTRLYLAFTPSCNKDIAQTLPTPWNLLHAAKLAWSYLILSREHEHYRFINPLGGVGVFSVVGALAEKILTG
ncbi:MAG: cytochrome b/b6 domain-containing protein, partial [Nitrospinae bacterium]|nr:cytochrome b/b6 domain-containing protein [Nitrospinota bacterium]